MSAPAAYDLAPLLRMALLGLCLAMAPLAWVWLRNRKANTTGRLRALTFVTLFLTFDLVLFGAFTRLTDSGLGCPDWPGCYGNASPLGARDEIHAAQTAMPGGPVTHGKAWVEMVHRYLATAVGVLIATLALGSWLEARRRRALLAPGWAFATLVWVCLQGAFGALTVTMKLYPAIVTLHLLGGIGLLALLAVQSQAYERRPLPLPPRVHRALWIVLALVLAQVALGGWVSTNYAVLACRDLPTCQGQWWPAMDFDHGFTLLRELGAGRDGGSLPFAALTAIHVTHRIGALLVSLALVVLGVALWATRDPAARRWALALLAVLGVQLASGLGTVLLGWPLAVAVVHTAGASALVTLLALMLARAAQARRAAAPAAAAKSLAALPSS